MPIKVTVDTTEHPFRLSDGQLEAIRILADDGVVIITEVWKGPTGELLTRVVPIPERPIERSGLIEPPGELVEQENGWLGFKRKTKPGKPTT